MELTQEEKQVLTLLNSARVDGIEEWVQKFINLPKDRIHKIVEKFKGDEESVVVKLVKNNYGANEFLVEALIYDSAEHRNKIEPKKKEKKKAGAAK